MFKLTEIIYHNNALYFILLYWKS